MERIRTSTNTGIDPQGAGLYVAGANPAGYFTDGNPGVVDGTIVGALWLNQVQEELINAILVDSAIVAAVDVTVDTQLATAIGALRALRSHATDTTSLSTTHTRALLACSNSRASGLRSAAIASESATVVSGQSSAALGASAATCDGTQCVAIGSTTVNLSGIRSVAIGSSLCGSIAGSQDSALIACGAGVAAGDATSNNTCAIASIESVGTCAATGEQSLVAASDDGQATGDKSAVIACDTCTSSGPESACIASQSSTAGTSSNAAVLASMWGQAGQIQTAVVASRGTTSDPVEVLKPASAAVGANAGCRIATAVAAGGAVLLSSSWCELADDDVIAAGYGPEAESSAGGTDWTYNGTNQHLTFKIDVTTGNGYFDGAADLGAADYAEMFENAEPGVLEPGTLLTRHGTRCQVAEPGDRVLGAVSARPGVVGNTSALRWHGKHETDEWGREQRIDVEYVRWPAIQEAVPDRAAAQSRIDAAVERLAQAVDAAAAARLREGDKLEWMQEPSEAFRDATARLLRDGQVPGRRRVKHWHKVPRVPENAHLYRVVDECYSQVEAADRYARAHVAERTAAAVADLASAQAEVAGAHEAIGGIKAARVAREAYDGRTDGAPVPVPDDAERYVRRHRKLADGVDLRRPYVSRKDRPEEWTCVGLLGQLRIRVDETVKPDDFVVPGLGGIGTAAKKAASGRSIECMEILCPHTEDRGFGIALCLVG